MINRATDIWEDVVSSDAAIYRDRVQNMQFNAVPDVGIASYR